MPHITNTANTDPLKLVNKPQFISIVPADFSEGVIYESHTHEYTEIMLILEGNGIQTINGKSYPVKAGDIILLNQYCIHAERSEKENPVSLVALKMDNIQFEGLKPGQIVPDDIPPVIASDSIFEELRSILHEMYYEKSFMDDFSSTLIELDMRRILCMVFRLTKKAPALKDSTKKMDNLILAVQKYIDEHYTESISLESLSSQFFVSVSFLVHAFKRETGKSPINYLIDRRMGEAQRYLSYTNLSVSEISERIGYDNVCYFNKVFLKRTGFQPSAFRDLYSLKKHM